MKHIGEAWERDDGVIAVIVAESPSTDQEVLLSGVSSWIPYDDLPVLGWTRLAWRITIEPEATP